LADGCTHRRGSYRSGKGGGDFSRLAAHELFHRDLPVTVHVSRGMKASGLFQVGACGFCQLLDGQAAGFVLVGSEEALFIRHRFRLGGLHRLRGWLRCHHGAEGSGKSISGRLVLPPVVEVSHNGFRSRRGIAWRTWKGDARGASGEWDRIFRSR